MDYFSSVHLSSDSSKYLLVLEVSGSCADVVSHQIFKTFILKVDTELCQTTCFQSSPVLMQKIRRFKIDTNPNFHSRVTLWVPPPFFESQSL